MQLESIIERIDGAFGESLPLSTLHLVEADLAVLGRVFGDDSYQVYMQDEHNRQIIRDYLTNAVVLGVIREDQLSAFSGRVATEEGRSLLSLHMLMSSVEDADALAANDEPEVLESFQAGPDSKPHMTLVPN